MRFSDETLKMLAIKIIMNITNGNMDIVNDKNPLTNPDIIDKIITYFFNIGGQKHLDFISSMTALNYTIEILKVYNGTEIVKEIIERFLKPRTIPGQFISYDVINKTDLAMEFESYLKRDGYKLVVEIKDVFFSTDKGLYYHVLNKKEFVKDTLEIRKNKTTKDIKEEAEKRFAEGNYPAAINECFNLVEAVIKGIIRAHGKEPEGNFKSAYSQLSKILDLKPAGENIESYLREVLQGLTGQVSGLYHLGNKAGTRHPAEFVAKRQDAKLVMNAAFTLCEYLIDTHKAHKGRPAELTKS